MRWLPVALADTNPSAEATAPSPGTMALPPRADHAHQRLSSTTTQSTAANGEQTVTFTRAFDKEPGITCTAREDTDNGALTYKVRSFVMSGPQYVGVVIKFYRIQPLPNVLVLLSALLNFRVDAGAVGVLPFSCVAIASSAP